MLAQIFDAVAGLTYGLAGGKGEKPESMAKKFLINRNEKDNQNIEAFASGEDFETRRNELLKNIKKQTGVK